MSTKKLKIDKLDLINSLYRTWNIKELKAQQGLLDACYLLHWKPAYLYNHGWQAGIERDGITYEVRFTESYYLEEVSHFRLSFRHCKAVGVAVCLIKPVYKKVTLDSSANSANSSSSARGAL